MNIPYKSIYEALPSDKANRATKGKSRFIPSEDKFNKLKYKNTIKKIETLIKTINSLINKFRNSFSKTNAKKLKIKNSDICISWKVSIFPKEIVDGYDEIARIEFLPSQEKIRNKIIELFTELSDTLETIRNEESSEFLPEKYKFINNIIDTNDWKPKGSWAKSSAYDINSLIDAWENIGITPSTSYEGIKGLYRLHATNPPPACLKGQFTGKPGVGLLMYKSVIHYCGHGYTSSQSDQSKNVWVSIKKDSDIISFEYESHEGMIAISTLLPKEDVIKILDRYIIETNKVYKSFYEWCKYRMSEGDELENILDNELYALIQNDIEQIKAGVLQSNVNSVYDDWYGGKDNDDEEDEDYNMPFAIDNYSLSSIFYDGFKDSQLNDYIKLFRKDIYDSDLENLLHEGLDESEAEQEMKARMRDLRIVYYWEDVVGENLYDTYLDYYERKHGEIILYSELDNYGLDIDSFKKDGMYYDNVVNKFNQKINQLEAGVKRSEGFGTFGTSTTKKSSSSTTKNNYTSKGNTNEVFDIVDEGEDIIVDVSNLQWSKVYAKMTLEQAVSNTPSGYRLPTIQELNSQIKKDNSGFDYNDYWSSSKTTYFGHWTMDINLKEIYTTLNKNSKFNVRYVKDI